MTTPEVDELLARVRREGKTWRYLWTLLWLGGWRHLFSCAKPEHQIRAALVVLDGGTCDHEWIDAKNQAVTSGEWCRKCNAVRAAGE